MTRFKTIAAALAALVMAGTAAHADCKLSTVAGKTWMLSGVDTLSSQKIILTCKMVFSAAGTVAPSATGCTAYSPVASSMNYVAIVSGTATPLTGFCGFAIDLSLVNPGAQVIRASLMLDSGKTVGSGILVSNFGISGSASILRQ